MRNCLDWAIWKALRATKGSPELGSSEPLKQLIITLSQTTRPHSEVCCVKERNLREFDLETRLMEALQGNHKISEDVFDQHATLLMS